MSHRKRKVGKSGKKRSGGSRKTDLIIKIAALGIGYFGADTINPMIDKIVPKSKDASGVETPNETLAIAAELGLGGLLLLKKMPVGSKTVQTALTAAGGILAGAGLKRGLKKLGVISGYQSTPVIGRYRMAGYQSTPVIGRMAVPNQLSGVPNQLTGYKPAGSGVGGYKSQGSGVMGSTNLQNGNGLLDH